MLGRSGRDQGQLFYSFNLEEVVPDDHLVRAIADVLDLSWVRAELAPYYSALGRPSIDPVLMIRMLVVRYRLPGRLAKTEVFARRGAIERRSRCCSPISSAFCGSTACVCEAPAAPSSSSR